jgi:hypothetical protein
MARRRGIGPSRSPRARTDSGPDRWTRCPRPRQASSPGQSYDHIGGTGSARSCWALLWRPFTRQKGRDDL